MTNVQSRTNLVPQAVEKGSTTSRSYDLMSVTQCKEPRARKEDALSSRSTQNSFAKYFVEEKASLDNVTIGPMSSSDIHDMISRRVFHL